MIITTFGNKRRHHISIDGKVTEFKTELELVKFAHTHNIFFDTMKYTMVEQPIKDMYYKVWHKKTHN